MQEQEGHSTINQMKYLRVVLRAGKARTTQRVGGRGPLGDLVRDSLLETGAWSEMRTVGGRGSGLRREERASGQR